MKNKLQGLTKSEIEKKISLNQTNIIHNNISKSYQDIILENVFTFFNAINLTIFLLLIFVGSYENIFFALAVVINTAIGIYQEIKAKLTLDKLSVLTSKQVIVIRDFVEQTINIDKLVLGDLIILKSGQQVPADCVLVYGNCEVNESLLTGESNSITKSIGDELLSGSYLSSGNGTFEVIRVGDDNYINKLTSKAKKVRNYHSILQESINIILKIASYCIIPTGILLFLKQYLINNITFNNSVIGTVGAIIGMIPAGIVLLTTVALSVSVIRLSKKNTLIQELYCIETLARVDMICLDKTGTITTGDLEVESFISEDNDFKLILANILNNQEDNNSTSLALKQYFGTDSTYQSEYVIPFSSERKYSGVCFKDIGTYYLGAREYLFKDNKGLKKQTERYSNDGFRILVVGKSQQAIHDNRLPEDLTVVGFIIIADSLRPGIKETVKYLTNQEVAMKVISGDSASTVAKIASIAGIDTTNGYQDASTLNDAQLIDSLDNYNIYGRVSPQQKRLMINALKDKGHIVAMTGDGVNDVLALKDSNCSIAMNNGSQAAKDIANIILLNNDFNNITHIINEGRRVINNISKSASMFLIKTTFSFLLAIIIILFGHIYPYQPVHLTYISALCVGIPTFFLTYEANFKRIKGYFITSILKTAIPYAIVITITSIFTAQVGYLLNESKETIYTICLIVTGFIYFNALFNIYSPLNKYRKVILFTLVFVFFTGLIFVENIINIAPLSLFNIVSSLVIYSVAYGLLILIRKLINYLFIKFNFIKEAD